MVTQIQLVKLIFISWFQIDEEKEIVHDSNNCSTVVLKFMLSKKATKIDEIFTIDLTLTT